MNSVSKFILSLNTAKEDNPSASENMIGKETEKASIFDSCEKEPNDIKFGEIA